jgi:hypothetical protein
MLIDFKKAAERTGLPVKSAQDYRMFLQEDGSIATSIMLGGHGSVGTCQFVGSLQIEAAPAGSAERVSTRLDIRTLLTDEDNMTACKVHRKNMMFMQAPGDDLYLTEWIYPPRVGKLDLKSTPQKVDKLGGTFEGTSGSTWANLYKHSAYKRLEEESIWGEAPSTEFNASDKTSRASTSKEIQYNEACGGPQLLWLEDGQRFLGLGHFRRGKGDSAENIDNGHTTAVWGHHYTFFFFTLSKSSPFQVTSLSSEFCFPSDLDSKDCDVVQFATGMEQDGKKLHIGYSTNDKDAKVATVNMQSVLSSLRPVH